MQVVMDLYQMVVLKADLEALILVAAVVVLAAITGQDNQELLVDLVW
jgi:hypothetical protein